MMPLVAQRRALVCHPERPSQSLGAMHARLSENHNGAILITYSLRGQIRRICIPAKSAPIRVDRLWQHTCFEAFVAVKGAPGYREFNFAPSGEWAAYAFQRYREGGPLPDVSDPQITIRTSETSLELDVRIERESLPPLPVGARLLLALSAVIEEEHGVMSYWALEHPPGPPDFHHASGFVLEWVPHVAAVLDSAYTAKR